MNYLQNQLDCVMLSIIYLGFNQLEFPKEWNLYDYEPNSQDNKIGLKMILHNMSG